MWGIALHSRVLYMVNPKTLIPYSLNTVAYTLNPISLVQTLDSESTHMGRHSWLTAKHTSTHAIRAKPTGPSAYIVEITGTGLQIQCFGSGVKEYYYHSFSLESIKQELLDESSVSQCVCFVRLRGPFSIVKVQVRLYLHPQAPSATSHMRGPLQPPQRNPQAANGLKPSGFRQGPSSPVKLQQNST